ncbi:MAG: glycosyltransferase family 4 protein [Anaerolineales bacterium]
MVTTFYPPYNFGGDGIWVYRLTKGLARRGHRVDVVFNPNAYRLMGGVPVPSSANPGTELQSDESPEHAGVRLHPLPEPRFGSLGLLIDHQLGKPFAHKDELKTFLEQNHFDVIHFHNISLLGGPGVLALGKGVKLCTLNDHWFVCPMHILWRFNREPCQKRTCLACTLAGKRPPQLWRYAGGLKRAIQSVDSFIVPSASAVQTHRRNGLPVPRERTTASSRTTASGQTTASSQTTASGRTRNGSRKPIRVLPYFIPDEEAALAARGREERRHPEPYFLFVGRLEKLKGVQVLIDVFRTYRSAHLLIAGTGTYEKTLHRQAAGLDHVHFLGFQPETHLHSLYTHAIATLVSSIGYETFGWTSLESFVHRTPAIVHNLGPLPEVIQGGGGIVYESTAELVEAMETIRTQPELRNRLGEEGYQNYRQNFTEEAHIGRYLQLINEIWGSRDTP